MSNREQIKDGGSISPDAIVRSPAIAHPNSPPLQTQTKWTVRRRPQSAVSHRTVSRLPFFRFVLVVRLLFRCVGIFPPVLRLSNFQAAGHFGRFCSGAGSPAGSPAGLPAGSPGGLLCRTAAVRLPETVSSETWAS